MLVTVAGSGAWCMSIGSMQSLSMYGWILRALNNRTAAAARHKCATAGDGTGGLHDDERQALGQRVDGWRASLRHVRACAEVTGKPTGALALSAASRFIDGRSSLGRGAVWVAGDLVRQPGASATQVASDSRSSKAKPLQHCCGMRAFMGGNDEGL